ncbi:MAG TPA: type IV toxin-antitoxin system AbiEi family antitoxin domain-containing protein [Gammaproteobacteria bacterium]|jgi:predicted transcriptional regulator of viral defense system|nr:type IV toxin-antitoxin system AbiEi family antitoxin domain-containing protein [Gammaproteobacteria bacterium]
MNQPSGIGKLDRARIAMLLRSTQHTISVSEAATLLSLPREHAAKILARWAAKGWVSRIKRGLYIPVPLASITGDIPLEHPWAVAEKLFHPCYIGGWSAAEYWGLTEQIFRTLVVLTIARPRNRKPVIHGTDFLLHTISKQALFGLKTIWQEKIKVSISDPTRTILDFLIDPKLGGGIRMTVDMLKEYLKSEHKNLPLLIDYANRLNNSAVFKRLGFLLEQYASNELNIINTCKEQVTISKTKLDPQLDADKLITRWRLWVPAYWKE